MSGGRKKARCKKQYRALSGAGRGDQPVAEIDRQLNKFRRMQPLLIEASAIEALPVKEG